MTTLLPLDIRLRKLEAQVYGVPPTLIDSSDHNAAQQQRQQLAGSSSAGTRGATRRLKDVSERLDRLGGESEGIKRLLDGYNQYLPLLSISSNLSSETTAGTSTITDSKQQGDDGQARRGETLTEADLLPDSVKLAMVLEAAGDIRSAERDLREIELLKKRGVEGSGDLESLIPLRPNLIKGIEKYQDRRVHIDAARKNVGALLSKYNEFTSTVSDLFLDVHHHLEVLEEGVARLERKKRKELAERY